MGFAQSMGLYYNEVGEAGYRASLGNNLPSLSIKSNSGGSGGGGYYPPYKEKEVQKSDLTNGEIGKIVAEGSAGAGSTAYAGNLNEYSPAIPFVWRILEAVRPFISTATLSPLMIASFIFYQGDSSPEYYNMLNKNNTWKDQVEGLVNGPVIIHLNKLEGKGSPDDGNPNDPRNRNDWRNHIQKALSNINKRLKNLNKQLDQVLKERGWTKESIKNLFDRLKNQGIDVK